MSDHVEILIRKAIPEDATALAQLMNSAGEGIPAYLWSRTAEPGVQAMELGARRAAQPDGTFSFKNARVAVREGVVAGMLLGYVLPDPYDVRDLEEYPDVVRPLVALEALVAGSWYINALAVTDRCRGQGIGRRLMSLAEELAELAAAPTLSLIVADENRIAVRLYERLGYKPIAHRRPVPYPGSHVRGSWILMTKPTPSNREDAASDRS